MGIEQRRAEALGKKYQRKQMSPLASTLDRRTTQQVKTHPNSTGLSEGHEYTINLQRYAAGYAGGR